MTRRKGFTLIELLVVIAIIALLMSILMPALSRVRKQAQSVTCMSQIRSWGLLYKLYTDDNGGFFPEGQGYPDHHPGQPGSYGLWMNALRPYYKDQWKLLKCPTATRVVLGSSDWGTFKAWYGTFDNRYPAAGEGATKLFEGSYGTSNWIDYMAANRGARLKEWFWKSTQNVTTPNQVPVIADNTWHDALAPAHRHAGGHAFRFRLGRQGHHRRDEPILHRPPQRLCQFRLCGLVRTPGGTQGVMDPPLASGLQCQRALDQRGRRDGQRLAAVAAEIQGLLRERAEIKWAVPFVRHSPKGDYQARFSSKAESNQ